MELSLDDIIKLEDEFSATLGVPTGVLARYAKKSPKSPARRATIAKLDSVRSRSNGTPHRFRLRATKKD
jgi:hypothetical protein